MKPLICLVAFFAVAWAWASSDDGPDVYDIISYGASPDGKTNCTDAILQAFQAANASSAPVVKVLIPSHSALLPGFLSWPVALRSLRPMIVDIGGTLRAPGNVSAWGTVPAEQFYRFEDCDMLQLVSSNGRGIINGTGSAWWAIRRVTPSHPAPYLVKIVNSKQVLVSGVHLSYSPKFHLVLDDCANPRVDSVAITAPKSSPNTDGIDPGGSTSGLVISNVRVSNGDDGVAIKPGASNILIENSVFADGHGVSIGSVGEDNSTGYVSDVMVRNVTFHSTTNGCRIKTWQNGQGAVRNITFDNIQLFSVGEPVRINQYYCPHSQHPGPCANSTRAVAISDITFRNMVGTQTSGYAGEILCSDAVPCQGITLQNVSITAKLPLVVQNRFSCWEAFGSSEAVKPTSCLRTSG